MTFDRIQELITYLPDNSIYFDDIQSIDAQTLSINKFIKSYKDLAFGYHFVKTLVDSKIELPLTVDEEAIIDTYKFLKFNIFNPDIVFAISLTHPTNKSMEDTLKAFLISDEPYSKLSKITGLKEDIIKIYEQLFFNIRDRKQEALFIANTVYPDTRLVEIADNYTKNEDYGKLLMRSAYNNGIEDAAYFSGLKSDSFITSDINSSAEMAQKLEVAIMANGYFLARNGYLNTKSSGITHAKGILIAAKQGGQGNSMEDTEGAGILGDAMMDTFLDIKSEEMDNKLELYKEIEMSKEYKKEEEQ